MNEIKVSVILPVYNAEKYLVRCLDSIVNQTLREIEIICIDDGSTDDSLKILNKYASEDPRIRVVSQANAGAGAARNNGMAMASGTYLSFLDSDDFFELNMLENAYNVALKENSDIVVFGSDRYCDDINEFKEIRSTIKEAYLPPYRPFNRYALTGNVFTVFVGWAWDKLFRADFVRNHNLSFQEQRTSNDLLFVFSAIVLAERISVSEGVFVHQRQNNKESLSNTRERSWKCFYYALKALRDNLIKYGLMYELEQDYINYALHFSLWNLETITGPKKEELYNKLKNEWFDEFGISDKNRDYFYVKSEYKEFLKIKSSEYDRYTSESILKKNAKRIKAILMHGGR